MKRLRNPRSPEIGRGGFTMTEVTVAATLLVAVVAVVTPLAVRSGQVRQDTRRHLIACEELSNQLERLTILDGAALEEGIDQLAAVAIRGGRAAWRHAPGPARQRCGWTTDRDGHRMGSPAAGQADHDDRLGRSATGISGGGFAMNGRRGFTLLELLLVITAGGMLSLVAIGLVHRTMRLNSLSREQIDLQAKTARFTRQLRRDVHRSESARLSNDGLQTLTLATNPPAIYTFSPTAVLRRKSLADGREHRETYRFGDDTTYLLSIDSGRVDVVAEQRRSTENSTPRILFEFEAHVGRIPGVTSVDEITPPEQQP